MRLAFVAAVCPAVGDGGGEQRGGDGAEERDVPVGEDWPGAEQAYFFKHGRTTRATMEGVCGVGGRREGRKRMRGVI